MTTPLAAGAAALREVFETFVAAGFTEEQAMRVVLALATNPPPAPPPPPSTSLAGDQWLS